MKHYPSIQVEAMAKSDGKGIFCPRCGRPVSLRAVLTEWEISAAFSCDCTESFSWHVEGREGNAFKVWGLILPGQIERAAAEP